MSPIAHPTACSSSFDSSPEMPARVSWIVASCLLLLTGCGYETLYARLDEQQANEMLALLLSHQIQARKGRADDEWSLAVKGGDVAEAVTLLRAQGYPRDNYQSLGDVFSKEGFVSSPLEERARLLYALSQELSHTLSQIDGVIVARVHLAIPEQNAMKDEQQPSSASIFIKHHADARVATQTASIKALVVNSVEGLPYENVTVTFFPAAAPVERGASLDPSPLKRASVASPLWVSALASLIGGGILYRRRRRSP